MNLGPMLGIGDTLKKKLRKIKEFKRKRIQSWTCLCSREPQAKESGLLRAQAHWNAHASSWGSGPQWVTYLVCLGRAQRVISAGDSHPLTLQFM